MPVGVLIRLRPFLLVLVLLSALAAGALADGFSLTWSLAHEPHVVLRLTDTQIATVGRERKLVLTGAQTKLLGKKVAHVPAVLGVESLGEPDCSCHIASAMWTATGEVTIWTARLARDPDGSRIYHELRGKPGMFNADAQGAIYHAGKPVAWRTFERAVRAMKEGGYMQLSLPPTPPREFMARVEKLKARKHFYSRL